MGCQLLNWPQELALIGESTVINSWVLERAILLLGSEARGWEEGIVGSCFQLGCGWISRKRLCSKLLRTLKLGHKIPVYQPKEKKRLFFGGLEGKRWCGHLEEQQEEEQGLFKPL